MAGMMAPPWQTMTRSNAGLSATQDMGAALAVLEWRLGNAREFNIGFPGAVDFDHAALARLLPRELVDNVGDPYVDGVGANHTKAIELDAVGFVADLLRAPRDQRWGYVTTGETESNLYALHQARRRYRDGVFYRSEAAHHSVEKAIDMLRASSEVVRTLDGGEMSYDDLARSYQTRQHRLSQPHALTVVLKTPPAAVTERWTLASWHGWSHVTCMPGVHQNQIDAFVADLANAIGVPASGTNRPVSRP